MKTIKILSVFFLICISFLTYSQEEEAKKDKKVMKIKIQTSAQCEQCKVRLEKDMAYEKGVKYVNLNLENKVLTLKYKVDKTDPLKLKTAVTKIGYDADDLPADLQAYNKLPKCCQKGGHDH